MSYFDKIIDSVRIGSVVVHTSQAIPHQSFTPRQILEQFVINDLQVMSHQSSDFISVPDGDCDIDAVDNAVMDFEDEFQAHSFVKNELPRIRKQKQEMAAQKAASAAAETGNKDGTLSSEDKSSAVKESTPAKADS